MADNVKICTPFGVCEPCPQDAVRPRPSLLHRLTNPTAFRTLLPAIREPSLDALRQRQRQPTTPVTPTSQ